MLDLGITVAFLIDVIRNEFDHVPGGLQAPILVRAKYEFIVRLLHHDLNCTGLDILVHNILLGSREPEEDAMIDMWVSFGWLIAGDLHCDQCVKSPDMFHAWFAATPLLVGSHFVFLRGRLGCINKRCTELYHSKIWHRGSCCTTDNKPCS